MVYKGVEGYLLLHVAQGRIFLHAGLKGDKKLSTFKRQREILDNLELDLAEKGIKRYYTVVNTTKQWRYAYHMGFEMTGEVLVGADYAIMYKDL